MMIDYYSIDNFIGESIMKMPAEIYRLGVKFAGIFTFSL